MKMGRIGSWCVGLAAAIALAGCGLAPIEKGQPVKLGPNDGIAAVVIDSLDNLDQMMIQGTDKNGITLKISNAPVGLHLYVFVVPAGTYCLSRFSLGFATIEQNDQKHGVCFDVIAGKIAYSGNLAPRAYGQNDLRTDQEYDWKAFEAKLKAEYPDLAARYPIVTP